MDNRQQFEGEVKALFPDDFDADEKFSGIPPQIVIGTAKDIYQGVKTLAKFTSELVKRLGGTITLYHF